MLDVRLPDFNFTLPITVFFRDLDAMAHVNNATYFSYFEEARSRYWLSLFEHAMDFKKLGFIVVHAECDYVSGAAYGEALLVGCKVTGIGRSSFAIDYRIVSGEATTDAQARIVATGKTVQALFDWTTQKTVPFTEDLRRRLEAREGPIKALGSH